MQTNTERNKHLAKNELTILDAIYERIGTLFLFDKRWFHIFFISLNSFLWIILT